MMMDYNSDGSPPVEEEIIFVKNILLKDRMKNVASDELLLQLNDLTTIDSALGSLDWRSQTRRFMRMQDFVHFLYHAENKNTHYLHTIFIVVSDDEQMYNRVSYGILDLVSDVGGLMGPVRLFFSLIAQSVS